MDVEIYVIIGIILLAFVCEFIDSSFGGGYGTILTPVFLLFGLDPFLIIPSILLSEIATGFSSCFFHHKRNNVNFQDKTEKSFHIAIVIGTIGVAATIITTFFVIKLPGFYVKLYIGLLVASMGVLLLLRITYDFSWKRIIIVGALSAFNKTISGGGYGPLITAGQVVGGQGTKKSIGTTQFCEGMVCVAGIISYAIFRGTIDLIFPLILMMGAVPATPVASLFVGKIKREELIKKLLGIICITLGIFSLIKLLVS